MDEKRLTNRELPDEETFGRMLDQFLPTLKGTKPWPAGCHLDPPGLSDPDAVDAHVYNVQARALYMAQMSMYRRLMGLDED